MSTVGVSPETVIVSLDPTRRSALTAAEGRGQLDTLLLHALNPVSVNVTLTPGTSPTIFLATPSVTTVRTFDHAGLAA